MLKNKNILFSIFMLSFLFFGCKSTYVEKVLSNKKFVSLSSNPDKVKFYFPEFYDENGTVINGDGIVAIFPDNKVMVIDGFMPEAAEQYIQFLNNLGITKIDYLVATHYHADHIGSFPKLINNFEIGMFYSNGAPTGNKSSFKIEDYLANSPLEHTVLKEGDTFSISGLFFEVFSPNLSEEDLYDIKFNPGKTAALVNLSSLVFKMTYNNFSVLITGDVYQSGEKAIVKKYGKKIHSTIVSASHHGEWYTANNPQFVKTVSADYAIIQDNRYITNVIKNRYKKAGTQILYRVKPGYILLVSDGINYNIQQFDGYQ